MQTSDKQYPRPGMKVRCACRSLCIDPVLTDAAQQPGFHFMHPAAVEMHGIQVPQPGGYFCTVGKCRGRGHLRPGTGTSRQPHGRGVRRVRHQPAERIWFQLLYGGSAQDLGGRVDLPVLTLPVLIFTSVCRRESVGFFNGLPHPARQSTYLSRHSTGTKTPLTRGSWISISIGSMQSTHVVPGVAGIQVSSITNNLQSPHPV